MINARSGAVGSGGDQVILKDAGTVTDAAFAQVSGIEQITLAAGTDTVNLGANAGNAATTAEKAP